MLLVVVCFCTKEMLHCGVNTHKYFLDIEVGSSS